MQKSVDKLMFCNSVPQDQNGRHEMSHEILSRISTHQQDTMEYLELNKSNNLLNSPFCHPRAAISTHRSKLKHV